MLVLERKKNESIFITASDGSTIKIKIIRIRNKKVSLGFEASLDISIVRDDANEKK